MDKTVAKIDDIAEKETVTLKEAAEILGLKYHTARNILKKNNIGFINYGNKIVWIKDDVLDFKRKCYVKPEKEDKLIRRNA